MMVVVTEPMISPEESNQEGNNTVMTIRHILMENINKHHILYPMYLVFIQCKWSLTF